MTRPESLLEWATPPGSRGPRASLLGFGAFLAAGLTACTSGSDDQAAPRELAEASADEVTFDVSHVVSVNGVRTARLHADSMLAWRDSTHVLLGGLQLSIFDPQGRDRATITADSGRLFPRTDELEAMGSARLVVPAEGLEILSSELRFAPAEDRVWSRSPVVMRRQGCQIEGDGFEADMSFDDVTIEGTQERGCGG